MVSYGISSYVKLGWFPPFSRIRSSFLPGKWILVSGTGNWNLTPVVSEREQTNESAKRKQESCIKEQEHKWTNQRINRLIPKSDQHLISPYNITPESHIKVRRIKEMITN